MDFEEQISSPRFPDGSRQGTTKIKISEYKNYDGQTIVRDPENSISFGGDDTVRIQRGSNDTSDFGE